MGETERSDFGLNVEELESLFSLAEKPVKKVEKKKSSKVHLVGLKRSHNISIELGDEVDFSRIRNSLLDMDDSQFSLEQLHVLKRAVPTEQESTKLRNYSGDKSKLGQVELYFMEVMSIPRLENRIDSLIYKKTFVSLHRQAQRGAEHTEAGVVPDAWLEQLEAHSRGCARGGKLHEHGHLQGFRRRIQDRVPTEAEGHQGQG